MNTIGWFDFKRLFDASRTTVVGNAASVGGSHLGPRIDAASLIVRFNQAQTIGFEDHVGSRTDLLICNLHQFEAPMPNRVATKAVLAFVDYRSNRADVARLQEWIGEIPVFFSLVPDILPSLAVQRVRGFTSGIYGLHVLLSFFAINELFVTGFNFYEGNVGTTGHYWESEVVPAPIEHDLNLDKEMFVRLLTGFSGHLDVSPEISRFLNIRTAEAQDQKRHFTRSLWQTASGKLGWQLLRAGMKLRRWSEA